MKNLILILVGLLFYNCASTHPGNKATVLGDNSIHLPLVVSAKDISLKSEDPFQLVEITIENTENEWVKIDETAVVLDNFAETKVSIVHGKDLEDWADAMKNRENKSNHNNYIAQLIGMIGGAGLMFVDNKAAKLIGMGLYAGATTWRTVDILGGSKKKGEGVSYVPDSHFLTRFSIPGKSFLRKWILFNKSNKQGLSKLRLTLKTVEGSKEQYEINL